MISKGIKEGHKKQMIEKLKNEMKETQKKDFNNSEIQYHGKAKTYKR
jgi:hypothetical protein